MHTITTRIERRKERIQSSVIEELRNSEKHVCSASSISRAYPDAQYYVKTVVNRGYAKVTGLVIKCGNKYGDAFITHLKEHFLQEAEEASLMHIARVTRSLFETWFDTYGMQAWVISETGTSRAGTTKISSELYIREQDD